MMKKTILAALAATALMSAPAAAEPAGAMNNWAGFYTGGLLTYGNGDNQHCSLPGACSEKFNINGWMGGGTLGYNWQISNLVLGVEGDGSWGDVHGSYPGTNFSCGGNNPCTTKVEALYTLRGRLGVAFGRVLAYGTAGIGWTEMNGMINGNSQDTTTKGSLVWGGGFEYAFAPQWTAKLEYLSVEKLGDFAYDKLGACSPPRPCYMHDLKYDTIRVGLNYKFGN